MHSEVPVESATTTSSRARLEHIMNTPLIEDNAVSAPTPIDRHPATGRSRQPRRGWLAGGVAAAAILAVAGAAVVANLGDDDAVDDPTASSLELSLGEGDALASCLPFETSTLAGMSPAFAATATAVTETQVTLDVDTWYAGDEADTVVLAAQPGMQALIAGFDFEVGQQYLITAAEGAVNFCGYSGPATPELTAAFDTAFVG